MFGEQDQYKRYFYHCFPQWMGASDNTASPDYDKGIQILSQMFKWGLLLTPEEIIFHGEPYKDEKAAEPIIISQKRLCFTELGEAELPFHAQVFGPIALEFNQQTLRRIGGIPVIYIPQSLSQDPESDCLALTAQTFVYRLFEVYQLISDLSDIQEHIKKLPRSESSITLGSAGGASHRIYSVEMLRNFLESLTHQRQSFDQLASAISTLSCFFYPTDAVVPTFPDSTELGRLAYYREREWRIVSGFCFAGIPLDEELCMDAKTEIAGIINNSFSPYENLCIDGNNFIHNCNIIRRFGGDHIMNSVHRILVPQEIQQEVQGTARKYGYKGIIVGYPKV